MNSLRPYVPTDPKQRYRNRMRNMAELARQVGSAEKPGISMEGSTTGAMPKPEVKAKPGKRTPNKAEREWMDKIVRYGCIACRMDGNGIVSPAVHHILRGGRRIGHLFTLPLCPGHHQDGYGAPGMVARHPTKARFEQRYGSEDFLLRKLRAEIGGMA